MKELQIGSLENFHEEPGALIVHIKHWLTVEVIMEARSGWKINSQRRVDICLLEKWKPSCLWQWIRRIKTNCFVFFLPERIDNISDFEVTDWQLARQLDAVAALQTVSMRLGYFYWDLNLSLIVIVATTGGLPVHVGHVDASVLGDHQAHQVNAFSSHYLSIWTSLKYGLILSVMFVHSRNIQTMTAELFIKRHWLCIEIIAKTSFLSKSVFYKETWST